MKAVVYRGPQQVAVEERPVPVLGAGEVLIRVHRAGICGTDLSIVAGHHPRARPGLVMGHEFVGTVEEVGPSASSGAGVGERVVVEPLISCGRCHACRAGFAYVCQDLQLYGIDVDGAFAGYVKVGARKAFRIPETLCDDAAALIEPLAVAVHAVRSSSLRVGDTACVLGGGPIGLLTALVAGQAGLADLVLVEPQPYRIGLAREFGLDVIDPGEGDVRGEIQRRTGGCGVHTVFEAAGVPATLRAAPDLCRIRGEIIEIAMPKVPREMNIFAIAFRELTIQGVRVYDPCDFQRAIHLAATWPHDLARLASGRYPLDQPEEAFAAAEQGAAVLKVLFDTS